MQLTNKLTFNTLILLCRLSVLFILVFIGLYFFYKKATGSILLLSEYLMIAGIVIIAILNIFMPSFFSLTKDGNLLMIRFFKMSPIKLITFAEYPKKQINITTDNLVKYEISKKAFGLVKKLILTVRTEKGEANYPPIDVTYVSEKKLRNILD